MHVSICAAALLPYRAHFSGATNTLWPKIAQLHSAQPRGGALTLNSSHYLSWVYPIMSLLGTQGSQKGDKIDAK